MTIKIAVWWWWCTSQPRNLVSTNQNASLPGIICGTSRGTTKNIKMSRSQVTMNFSGFLPKCPERTTFFAKFLFLPKRHKNSSAESSKHDSACVNSLHSGATTPPPKVGASTNQRAVFRLARVSKLEKRDNANSLVTLCRNSIFSKKKTEKINETKWCWLDQDIEQVESIFARRPPKRGGYFAKKNEKYF